MRRDPMGTPGAAIQIHSGGFTFTSPAVEGITLSFLCLASQGTKRPSLQDYLPSLRVESSQPIGDAVFVPPKLRVAAVRLLSKTDLIL